ncbi:hypothetical protein FA95DRAFT_1558213 [Auriscalpium vulgare]|uniref:Uncharacterized protein n=1 Tax=Auriscalpium vulgare TaxID=40419 RepID=A0ACB8RX55_9AGAM|nr:hypothetical protein FA95DRAFT_1558213 [Auriscalpium vulgare]
MHPNGHVELLSRPRALCRDWKCRKQNLSRSTSLPKLSLIPVGRPLFTCLRCGSLNIYVPLCLWCAWTSPDAARDFEAAIARVRPRRISSPVHIRDIRASQRSHEPPLGPLAQAAQESGVPTATPSLVVTTQPDSRHTKAKPLRRRPNLKPLTIHQPACPTFAPLCIGPSHPASAPALQPNFHDEASLPPLYNMSSTPTHALRRKQRHTVLRKKSSRSLRSRASIATLHSDRTVTIAPILQFPPHPRSESVPPPATIALPPEPIGMTSNSTSVLVPSVDSVRLGTPSRPYYTAIRRNMSPSPTPYLDVTSIQPNRVHSPAPPRGSSPLPIHGHFQGSLSGEMEQHMALAARRSEESETGTLNEFSFYFEEQRKKGGRVRRLGSGLWSLLGGR